jgi:hypothetical protein
MRTWFSILPTIIGRIAVRGTLSHGDWPLMYYHSLADGTSSSCIVSHAAWVRAERFTSGWRLPPHHPQQECMLRGAWRSASTHAMLQGPALNGPAHSLSQLTYVQWLLRCAAGMLARPGDIGVVH